MEHTLLQRFLQLIAAHTGLQIREQEREALGKTLAVRAKALQFRNLEHYYQLLKIDTQRAEAEWKLLIILLTNQESYFFRDKGQFKLLRERILPELIKANQERRTLRLWSAGCSTGEEPFSLAMLVDQLLPQRNGWNIFILGTDIKEAAVEKAQHGIYSPWSFRMVEPLLQQRYFREQQADYKLDMQILNMVTFRQGNLFKDEFPDVAAGLYGMDLILCRNVFIYFEGNAVSVVLDKFAETLRDGGYLMTGHAELNAQNSSRLQTRALPGSVIYQRLNNPPAATRSVATKNQAEPLPPLTPAIFSSASAAPLSQIVTRLPQPAQSSTRSSITQSAKEQKVLGDAHPSLLEEAKSLFFNRFYGTAAERIEHLLLSEPQNHAALCLAARAYANLGRHEEAAQRCRQAIAINALEPIPYSLLAHILEEQGDSEESKNLLKKVIYLVPSFTPAYLELGALYEKEGDLVRAQKMRATALGLLQALTPDAVVEPYGIAAQELIRELQQAHL